MHRGMHTQTHAHMRTMRQAKTRRYTLHRNKTAVEIRRVSCLGLASTSANLISYRNHPSINICLRAPVYDLKDDTDCSTTRSKRANPKKDIFGKPARSARQLFFLLVSLFVITEQKCRRRTPLRVRVRLAPKSTSEYKNSS